MRFDAPVVRERKENLDGENGIEVRRGYRVIQRNRFHNIMQKPMSAQVNWQAEINAALSSLSDKSVKNAWGLMTVIMRVNEIPVPRVLFPVPEKNEREFLDPQQIIAFCEAAKGDTCEMAMLLGLHSLRMSEIRALRFPDSFDIFVLPYCCRLLSLRLVMVLAGIELILKGRPIGRLFLFSTKINKKLVKSVH